MLNIIIGADIVPTKSNIHLFDSGDAEALVGKELIDILAEADFRIFNLEVPLTDKKDSIKKCGPNLIAPTSSILGYKSLGIDLLTLSNNHIMDQNAQGLFSTIDVLNKNNIFCVGAGVNLEEASKPYIIEKDNIKVGIYACAEHEFSIATDTLPGANPYEPLDSFDHVKALSEKCDFVIVLYHGGKEHYRYPSPMLQRVFRKFADVGADYIIAQHTHCVGCQEKYKDATLIYGQGNFIFDHADNEYWNSALLVNIRFVDNRISYCKYIPIQKQGNSIKIAFEKSDILSDFMKRSNDILQPDFIDNKYFEFALQMKNDYFYRMFGRLSRNFLIRLINKLTNHKLLDCNYKKDLFPNIENILQCEAHRELFSYYLQAIRRK